MMVKNLILTLTLIALPLFVGCGKENQNTQPKAAAAKVYPQLEIDKKIAPYSIVAVEADASNATHRTTPSTLVTVPALLKQNCFRSELIDNKSIYRTFSIYNTDCKTATDKNLVATLVHHTLNNKIYTPNGTRPPKVVGELLEIGMYPGPNVFIIRNLCGKFNRSAAKASCNFEIEPSGKIKSGSFKTF